MMQWNRWHALHHLRNIATGSCRFCCSSAFWKSSMVHTSAIADSAAGNASLVACCREAQQAHHPSSTTEIFLSRTTIGRLSEIAHSWSSLKRNRLQDMVRWLSIFEMHHSFVEYCQRYHGRIPCFPGTLEQALVRACNAMVRMTSPMQQRQHLLQILASCKQSLQSLRMV